MAKRIIEIEDELDDLVSVAIEEVKDELLRYLEDNPETDELPCINNDLDYSGAIHEIIDGSVPVYTHRINDIFYLHENEVKSAFDNAGIGNKDDDWPMGWKAAAVYCYIQEKVNEWYYNNAEDVFDNWKKDKEQLAEEAEEDRLREEIG